MNYYNEWDAGAAAWLRELIKAGHIPPGYVDERSITEVTPSDLEGFTQCHFFAGIGGWSYALQLAGIPATTQLWTGSPPCQPFSVAGKQLGQLDERHLAPTFMRLVAQCRPPVLFGEQVAAAIGKHWLDDLFTELEAEGYACGAAVLPACSVGAPHKRDRLFFGAVGDSAYLRQHRSGNTGTSGRYEHSNNGSACGMAESDSQQQRSDCQRTECGQHVPTGWEQDTAEAAGLCCDSELAHSSICERGEERENVRGRVNGNSTEGDSARCSAGSGDSSLADRNDDRQQSGCRRGCSGEPSSARHNAGRNGTDNAANPHHGFWSDADWLGCRDGKFRPVIASFISLVDGLPDSLGCCGYPRIRENSEVFKLPEGISAEAFFFRCAGKPIDAETAEILRSEMHGGSSGRSHKSIECEKFSETICENFDISLYELSEEYREDARASQGREPFKQQSVKLDDLMCELSQQSSLAELQQRNYDAQALRALRDACAEKWSVQHSFIEVEKVWASFSEEDKERERLGFNAGIWRRTEFFPLSSGEEGRVGRLRGYGNAIVPPVAAEFIIGFRAAIADCDGVDNAC